MSNIRVQITHHTSTKTIQVWFEDKGEHGIHGTKNGKRALKFYRSLHKPTMAYVNRD